MFDRQCYCELTLSYPSTVSMFAQMDPRQTITARHPELVMTTKIVRGEWLRAWLARMAMTQTELCDRIGVNQCDLSTFLSEKVSLVKALKVNAAVLKYVGAIPQVLHSPSMDDSARFTAAGRSQDCADSVGIGEGQTTNAVKRPMCADANIQQKRLRGPTRP